MSTRIIPVKSTVVSVQEPETDEERDARIAWQVEQWPQRIISTMTPEQRRKFKKLLLTKNKPVKSVGHPLRWTEQELFQLRQNFIDGRDNLGLRYNDNIESLALIYDLAVPTIKKAVTKANKIP